jgi:hypothetical protein
MEQGDLLLSTETSLIIYHLYFLPFFLLLQLRVIWRRKKLTINKIWLLSTIYHLYFLPFFFSNTRNLKKKKNAIIKIWLVCQLKICDNSILINDVKIEFLRIWKYKYDENTSDKLSDLFLLIEEDHLAP